jgi:hypothetical protein
MLAVFIAGAQAVAQPTRDSEVLVERLRRQLLAFAFDSIEGRTLGTRGMTRAEEFVIRALAQTAARPGFTNRSFADTIPAVQTQLDIGSALFHGDAASNRRGFNIGSPKFAPGVDFLPLTGNAFPFAQSANVNKKRVVFGGRLGTTNMIEPFKVAGAIVVFLPAVRGDGLPDYQVWRLAEQISAYKDAAAVLVTIIEIMPRAAQARFRAPQWELAPVRRSAPPRGPPVIAVSRALASLLLLMTVEAGEPGYTAEYRASITYDRRRIDPSVPARNIAAVVEGSDQRLRSEYVVLSAPLGGPGVADSSARSGRDSAFYGVNDGTAASIALLAIAERMSATANRPRRSVIFLWTAAAERGLLGSRWFTENSPVPRDRIVADINMGMLGRGSDGTEDGVAALQLAGSRRLSNELGTWIEEVNARPEFSFQLDYQFDAPGHPSGHYCHGDHWNFARFGIPSVFVTTGTLTDDPRVSGDVSTINFAAYARITNFVSAVAEDLANRPARPALSQPKPDPLASCVQ